MTQRERRRQVGQLLLAGIAGETIPVELRSIAREFDLGGLVLLPRNVTDPAQVADLARQAQELSSTAPVWVSLEDRAASTGLVAALTAWPTLATLGRADDVELTKRFGRARARELLAIGVSLALEPTLDLQRPGAAAERSLSEDPGTVARHGAALVDALRLAGLPACVRHFPGYGGATALDGDLPVADLPPDQLEHADWVPFRTVIDAGVNAVVACHVLVPSLDEDNAAPFSPAILGGRLRQQLGFNGVVLADDIDAPAAAARVGRGTAAARTVAAGSDGFLQLGGDMDRVHASLEGIVRALETQTLAWRRVDDALRRQLALKLRYLSDDARRRGPAAPTLRDVMGSAEHAAISEQMRQFM